MNTNSLNCNFLFKNLGERWTRFWMGYAGRTSFGRFATRLATWFAPPYKEGALVLAKMNKGGYIAPSATLYHRDIQFGANVFMGDRVIIFQARNGGPVKLGDRVCILRDTIIETGDSGSITLGADVYIHPRCQLNAYIAPIEIGCGVLIAANCSFYPHDHGIAPEQPIRDQPLETKGPIVIGDHAWLGTGVTVLGGVEIGKGAVIGAGSVVTKNIPDGAIAFGVPARVVKMRSDLKHKID